MNAQSAKPTQEQMFCRGHREASGVLQQAAFMSGLVGDNPNPLTEEEICATATAGKPYSWAFELICEGRLKKQKSTGNPVLFHLGRGFEVTGAFSSEKDANTFMSRNEKHGVINVIGGMVLTANVDDLGDPEIC